MFSACECLSNHVALILLQNGLARKQNQSLQLPPRSSSVSSASSSAPAAKTLRASAVFAGGMLQGGSLAIALQASRRNKTRTSFLRSGSTGTKEGTASFQKSIAFTHVVFQATNSRSSVPSNPSSNPVSSNLGGPSHQAKRLGGFLGLNAAAAKKPRKADTLWSKAIVGGFQKRT